MCLLLLFLQQLCVNVVSRLSQVNIKCLNDLQSNLKIQLPKLYAHIMNWFFTSFTFDTMLQLEDKQIKLTTRS